MQQHHTKAVFGLNNDDAILDLVMSKEAEDMSLYTPGTYELPFKAQTDDKPLPIQTADALRTEAEALKIDDSILTEIKRKEIRAVALVEQGYSRGVDGAGGAVPQQKSDFQGALKLFNEIIDQCPNYASAFNNRAQLNQLYALALEQYLKSKPENDVVQNNNIHSPEDIALAQTELQRKIRSLRLQALSDLNQSIAILYNLYPLFSPQGGKDLIAILQKQQQIQEKGNDETETNTQQQQQQQQDIIVPQVLVKALTQRALLHKLRGNDKLSFQDFKQASLLGSKLAQKELDEMNQFEVLNKEAVHKLMNDYLASLSQTASDNEQMLSHL